MVWLFNQLCYLVRRQIIAEADRLAREAFALEDKNRTFLTELDRQRERLTRLEYLYLDGDIGKDRFRVRKAELDQLIARQEDDLYAASQTPNFRHVINRMTATLSQISNTSPETKKTLINLVIERLEIGGGRMTHPTPRFWVRPSF